MKKAASHHKKAESHLGKMKDGEKKHEAKKMKEHKPKAKAKKAHKEK